MIKLLELLSENNPCWDGYKVGNPKTKISSKTGKRVNNCIPINEMGSNDIHFQNVIKHYDEGTPEEKSKIAQTVSMNKNATRDMILTDLSELNYREIKEVEEELGILDLVEMDEAFFIGEDQDITCEKCGWKWKLDNGGQDPYICHKCGYNNSDQIDEYDVNEDNLHEVKDFVKFMKEYTSFLAEAQCNCIMEAEYHGRKVQLGKPMQGDIKKFKVYVKNNKGKVVKVNFGFGGKSAKGKRMVIKAKNPKRRSAYRKRHHCDNPGPRWKANYWSCRKW